MTSGAPKPGQGFAQSRVLLPVLLALLTLPARADIATYPARDTLRIDPAEPALQRLAWPVADFTVTVTSPPPPHAAFNSATDADAIVTFASPRPEGDPAGPMNTVVLEWFRARGPAGQPLLKAPAVLTLHILDNRFILERGIARALSHRGIHCFVMQNPGWGRRRLENTPIDGSVFFDRAIQSVADARRSRDAIAALPSVIGSRISLQGASLGGFIASCAGAIDGCFDDVFIMLAGGNLYDMFMHGQNEARRIRAALESAGYTGDKLREFCDRLEPMRLAHRLDPAKTWLFSATTDQVVPGPNADALATAAHLTADHHPWMPGDHYSCVVHLPWLVNFMVNTIEKKPTPGKPDG